jgi:hypothetical protein
VSGDELWLGVQGDVLKQGGDREIEVWWEQGEEGVEVCVYERREVFEVEWVPTSVSAVSQDAPTHAERVC